MRKLLIAAFITLLSCGKSDSGSSTSSGSASGDRRCGAYNGHQLYKGSQGGCYYINSNNNKTYVDASKCTGC